MQSCYSSPQQLQAAAAAALSFHQHQHRLAFPLMPGAMSRLDQRDQRDDVDDDLNDDISSRLTTERRVRLIYLLIVLHLHARSQSGPTVNVPRQEFSCKNYAFPLYDKTTFEKCFSFRGFTRTPLGKVPLPGHHTRYGILVRRCLFTLCINL